MKSILLLIFSFCLIGVSFGQQVLFSENFDNYNNNQNVSAQSPFITTWSSGSSDDALVSQEESFSGSQSIKIDDASGVRTDILFPFNNILTGTVDIEFQMLIPENSGGYFNIQKTRNPGEEWAFDLFIGEEAWLILEGDTTFFDYPIAVWNKFDLSIDLDAVIATLSLNDSVVHSWNYTQTTTGANGLNQIGGLNLFAGSPPNLTPLFYIDDVSATFTASGSVSTKDNTSNETVSIYPNPASSDITISFEEASSANVTIINSSGKIVMEKVLNNSLANIDINSLEAGFYILKVYDGKKYSTKKLIIQ